MEFLSASFFDVNENGILDMYMNYFDKTDKNKIKFSSIYNYLSNQNYFLKIRGTNGGDGKVNKKKSTLFYGATFECTITTNDN